MNEEKFTGKAELYQKYRHGYSEQVLALIRREISISPETSIVDMGAGTGIFTKELLTLGCRVTAVEPNPDMLSQLRENAAGADIVDAPAEHTGLPEKSVSLITAALSFHWFNPEEFREECRRLLTDDGKIMIIWNLTDKTSDIIQRLHFLNLEHCRNYRKLFENGEPLKDRFVDITKQFLSKYQSECYVNHLQFDLQTFIGERLSCSYAPNSGEESYEAYVAALTDFFEENQQEGFIKIPNFTECFIGTI